jgi:hypothetical protein
VTIFGLTALWLVLYKLPPNNDISFDALNIMYLTVAASLVVVLVSTLSVQRDQRLRERRQDLAAAVANDD